MHLNQFYDKNINIIYSYSYDLTNTLQYNMQDPVYIQYPSDDEKEKSSEQTEENSCKQHLPIYLFIIK